MTVTQTCLGKQVEYQPFDQLQVLDLLMSTLFQDYKLAFIKSAKLFINGLSTGYELIKTHNRKYKTTSSVL